MTTSSLSRDDILDILEEVKDPEVPVLSVVELGVVRDVIVADERLTVVITPTYSGCPALAVMVDDIRAVLGARGITRVDVEVMLAPAWTTDWLTAAAKQKLRASGIAPPGAAPTGDLVALTRRGAVEAAQCPYCRSRDTTVRSEFGSTACKAICWCNACHQPFEQFKAI